MKLTLIKGLGGLLPQGDESIEYVQKLKTGAIIEAEFRQHRNPAFHRKYFALLNLGFDHWEPNLTVIDGQMSQKDFDRFRADVTILAGFYHVVSTVGGGTVLEADSISFANMSEERFERLYSKTIDVLLQKVLTSYGSREEVDRVVEDVMRFA